MDHKNDSMDSFYVTSNENRIQSIAAAIVSSEVAVGNNAEF